MLDPAASGKTRIAHVGRGGVRAKSDDRWVFEQQQGTRHEAHATARRSVADSGGLARPDSGSDSPRS